MRVEFFGWGKACFSCGALFQLMELDLCVQCFGYLQRASDQIGYVSGQNDFKKPIFFLYDWKISDNPILNRLIYQLKGGQSLRSFQLLARALWLQRLKHQSLGNEEIVFIPAPARKRGAIDHAGRLALELSNLTSGSYKSAFVRTEKSSQKGKSKKDRKKVPISRDEDFKIMDLEGKKVIFVDDVITTGATALAAWKKLNKFQNFEVWCLALRASMGLEQLSEPIDLNN